MTQSKDQQELASVLNAADYQAITALYARYSQSFDSADYRGCAELFSPDGTFSVPQRDPITGTANLLAFFQAATERSRGTTHFVANIALTPISPVTVHGTASVLALRVDGDTLRLAALGRYDDEFIATEAGWRIRLRSMNTAVPATLLGAVIAATDA